MKSSALLFLSFSIFLVGPVHAARDDIPQTVPEIRNWVFADVPRAERVRRVERLLLAPSSSVSPAAKRVVISELQRDRDLGIRFMASPESPERPVHFNREEIRLLINDPEPVVRARIPQRLSPLLSDEQIASLLRDSNSYVRSAALASRKGRLIGPLAQRALVEGFVESGVNKQPLMALEALAGAEPMLEIDLQNRVAEFLDHPYATYSEAAFRVLSRSESPLIIRRIAGFLRSPHYQKRLFAAQSLPNGRRLILNDGGEDIEAMLRELLSDPYPAVVASAQNRIRSLEALRASSAACPSPGVDAVIRSIQSKKNLN